MRGGEPDPLDAVHVRGLKQQVAERAAPRVAVGVDRLAEELDLTESPFHQRAHLGQDIVHVAGDLAPSCLGNDAERAAVVASLDDRDERLRDAGDLAPDLIEREVNRVVPDRDVHDVPGGLIPRPQTIDQQRQRPRRPRSDDEIDVRRAIEDRLTLLLSDAAANAQDEIRPPILERLQPSELRENLLGRLLSNGARVQ